MLDIMLLLHSQHLSFVILPTYRVSQLLLVRTCVESFNISDTEDVEISGDTL